MTSGSPDKPDSPESSTDFSNRRLGDFLLLRRLGAGGMAQVYLAQQVSLQRMVAVKILEGDAIKGKNNTLLKRFEQEARAAGGLNHSNIVQVLMIDEAEGLNYIVQEYVQGENLAQNIKRHGSPDFLTGLKWMKEVAAALKAAADADIVHRDIKPENIMLTSDGVAKVTDFGLAQLNSSNQQMNLTQAGVTMGTPWYMSPEQIQGLKVDHRSDQYSFGVTCYHMFAGQPPFGGQNSVSVAVQHLQEEPVSLQQHRRDLPKELCSLIHRMMAKKPEERVQTAEQLQEELNRLDNVSINLDLADTSGPLAWWKSSLPTGKMALLVGAVCLAAGLVAGRAMFFPTPLPKPQVEFRGFDSAAEQYAMAILHANNESAWRAVLEKFPKSDEAVLARMQLALFHLRKGPSGVKDAEQWFDDLYKRAMEKFEDRREMAFFARLGQVKCAQLRNDTDTANRLIQNQLAVEFSQDLDNPPSETPAELLDLLRSIQESLT